jgi:hypothetical protein
MKEKINQILREHAGDPAKATAEIRKITSQNFSLYNEGGSLYVEFDDPTDSTDFGISLLEE